MDGIGNLWEFTTAKLRVSFIWKEWERCSNFFVLIQNFKKKNIAHVTRYFNSNFSKYSKISNVFYLFIYSLFNDTVIIRDCIVLRRNKISKRGI
jgi:hypothetical protein